MKVSDPPIQVQEHFAQSSSVIWKYLTEKDHMINWFFLQIPAFEAVTGFEVFFDVQAETRLFRHHWLVKEVVVNKKIVYQWNYPDYPGDGYVVFELEDTEAGCVLNFSSIITKDYDGSIPEFKRESCVGGWRYFINQNLKEYASNNLI